MARGRRCRWDGEDERLWRGGMKSGWGLSARRVVEDSDDSEPMMGLRLTTEPGSSANWGRSAMDDCRGWWW